MVLTLQTDNANTSAALGGEGEEKHCPVYLCSNEVFL